MPDPIHLLTCGVSSPLDDALRRTLAGHVTVSAFEGDCRDVEACRAQAAANVVVIQAPGDGDPVDRIDLATRGIWNILTTTSARRIILLSTMQLFAPLDEGWDIDERWVPRPTTDVATLAPWLAECAVRETARELPLDCAVLRLDDVVDAGQWAQGTPGPTWLHVDDAAAAIAAAVRTSTLPRWSVHHIVRGDPRSRYPRPEPREGSLAWEPHHRDRSPRTAPWPAPAMPPQPRPVAGLAPPRRVVILGAAGPLAVAAATQADPDLTLRLADRRSLAEAALAPPQTPGAPLPDPARMAHHEEVQLDVTDPGSVRRALEGMDTVVNCTVNRPDPVQAFRVNTLGAWHVMRAAVALGIRRVVHTGPVLGLAPYPIGVQEDREIRAGVDRPGTHLYFMSKYLGQEIVRIFAEEAGIATPALYFVDFTSTDPALARRRAHPCLISWDDAGRAVMAAARVTAMPRPFVAVNVLAPAPHERYADDDAQALLDWTPRDRIDDAWHRPAP